ncbi:hypothetical protein ACFX15_026096 [Malus domestica]
MSTERERQGSLPSTSPEDNALFLDIMHEAPLFGHRKSRNLFGSVFYLIILAGYSAVAVAAPWIFQAIDDLIPQLLCSCNVLLLVVTGIFQQYLVSQVQKIRLQGYYSFSQKLKHIVRVPFAVTSYGTAALLLVMVWRPNISFLTLPAILRYRNYQPMIPSISISSFRICSCSFIVSLPFFGFVVSTTLIT